MLDVLALEDLHVVLDIPHLLQVEPGVVLASLQGCDDAFDRRLRRPPSQRRHRNVQDLGARFHRGHVGHGRHPARAVRMHVDGHLDHLLESGHQLPGRLRAQEARCVLDDDLVAAHVDKPLC